MQAKNNFIAEKDNSSNILSDLELDYIFFEADEGGYIGYFKDFPQHVTEAETIDELEKMLLDMYDCLNLSKYHIRKLVIV